MPFQVSEQLDRYESCQWTTDFRFSANFSIALPIRFATDMLALLLPSFYFEKPIETVGTSFTNFHKLISGWRIGNIDKMEFLQQFHKENMSLEKSIEAIVKPTASMGSDNQKIWFKSFFVFVSYRRTRYRSDIIQESSLDCAGTHIYMCIPLVFVFLLSLIVSPRCLVFSFPFSLEFISQ